MEVKCSHCGREISNTIERCPYCGSSNDNLQRTGNGAPKTIEELKIWYKEHNLPAEDITRFFIGKDIKEPRAFGIYRDEYTKNYIVYKNKNDGSRAIRYQGLDENYAVNELYMKLKEEIQNQKRMNRQKEFPTEYDSKIGSATSGTMEDPLLLVHFISIFIVADFLFDFGTPGIAAFLTLFLTLNPGIFIIQLVTFFIKDENKKRRISTVWHILSFVLAILVFCIPIIKYNTIHSDDAYYVSSSGVEYYSYGDTWYYYNEDSWLIDTLIDENDLTYEGKDYSSSYGENFENSSIYSEGNIWNDNTYSSSSSSDSDWDSNSSWDSGDSWDSGSTDFDSDW